MGARVSALASADMWVAEQNHMVILHTFVTGWRLQAVSEALSQKQNQHPSQQRNLSTFWPSCLQKKNDFSFVSHQNLCDADEVFLAALILFLFCLRNGSFSILSVDDPPHNTDPCVVDGRLSASFVATVVHDSHDYVLLLWAPRYKKSLNLQSPRALIV